MAKNGKIDTVKIPELNFEMTKMAKPDRPAL
jgi:hypothetical protein